MAIIPSRTLYGPDAVLKRPDDHMAIVSRKAHLAIVNKPDFLPYALYGALWCLLAIFWFQRPFGVGVADWDWYFSDAFQSANGFIERGWFPFWTIQTRGGAPLAGNPESISQSPFIFILMAVGSIVGIKLLLLWLVAIGIAGCHLLGKHWFRDAWAAASFTFVFVFSGYFAIHLRVGHFTWAWFFFVPWILYFMDRILFGDILSSRDGWLLFMTVCLFILGPLYHPLVYFLIPICICYAITYAFKIHMMRVILTGVIFVLGTIVALPRIIAILHWELNNPRSIPWTDNFSIQDIFKMLIMPIKDYDTVIHAGHGLAWEYWAFIGIFSCILSAIGLIARGRWKWFALCMVLMGIMLSVSSDKGITLFVLLRELPIFSSVRVSSRFLILTVFGVALLVGGGVAVIRSSIASHPKFRLLWLLVFFVAIDYFLHVSPIWTQLFPVVPGHIYDSWDLQESDPPYGKIVSAPPFQQFTEEADRFDSLMFPLMKAKMIVRNAYTGMNLPPFLPVGDHVIEPAEDMRYLINNHQITLYGNFWPGQSIRLNLLYSPYWKPSAPEMASVENDRNLMKVSIHQACSSVDIRMSPPWEKMAWMISPLGILGMMLVDILWLRRAASR